AALRRGRAGSAAGADRHRATAHPGAALDPLLPVAAAPAAAGHREAAAAGRAAAAAATADHLHEDGARAGRRRVDAGLREHLTAEVRVRVLGERGRARLQLLDRAREIETHALGV